MSHSSCECGVRKGRRGSVSEHPRGTGLGRQVPPPGVLEFALFVTSASSYT